MTFDWWTLALQAVNFLVLVWLLQRFLYKPVTGIIEKRRQQADEVLHEAERAKADAETARQDYERRVDDLAGERQRLLDEAQATISEERRSAHDKARAEADELIAATRKNLEMEKAAALKSLRKQIADLAGEMAAKILKDTAPQVSDDAFLNVVCDRIDALPTREKGQLRKALAAKDGAITVVTAQPLRPANKTKWRKRLGAALNKDARITFSTNAGLIGGAELRFPEAVLRVSWDGELGKLKQMIVQDDVPS